MDNSSFGTYLRELRQSRNPRMTQEGLASAIGRSKMTVSQFEQGKNAPPQGALLDSIIAALSLSDDESRKLRFFAAFSRKGVPNDIEDYFFDNPSIYEAILTAKRESITDLDWRQVIV